MVLNWVEFKNKDINLSINRVHFNSNISLLVGLTGSGKSQIISAIEVLCGIATHSTSSFQSISGSISFSVNGNDYIWSVETIRSEEDDSDRDDVPNKIMNIYRMMYYDAKTIIASEHLSCNGETVFNRNDKENFISGFSEIPPCDNTRSYISLFNKYKKIKEANFAFKSIYQIWFRRPAAYKVNISALDDKIARFSFLSELAHDQEENKLAFPFFHDLISKIGILLDTNAGLWNEVLANYQSIFEEVEDIKIGPCLGSKEAVTIYFVINHVEIDIGNISSGMVKTLQLITDLFLSSESNVILIDELENGFGINCIDAVWDIVKKKARNIQFILTSHHPYVISNLDYSKFLIVQRKENEIFTQTGKEFKLDETHLDYYDMIFNRLENK